MPTAQPAQVQILVHPAGRPERVLGWTVCAPSEVARERVRLEAQGYVFVRAVAS